MEIAKNILVANDFGELGRGAMQQALALAEQLDAKLNVVAVFQGITHGPPSENRDPALQELRQEMDELRAQLQTSGRLVHAEVHFGEPAETILQVAQQLGADLIVMGTHGRRGFNRVAMGSTAEEVLRAAKVPVMVYRKAALTRALTARS